MRRVAPSVMAREQLQQLLAGGVDRESNIVSALVETVSRLVVQELLEGEQRDFLGGRGRYDRRGEDQAGSRNGYERGRLRTAEGFVDVAVPQVRGAAEPFRSSLMGFLDGNSEVLESLVNEMYARGLSTRDVEDAFRDATGELLISKSAVSRRSPTGCGRTTRPSSAGTCPGWRSSTCSWMRCLSRCAGTGRRRRCWSAGRSPPTAANTCCTWRSATRSPRPAGRSSSARCSAGGCGCRPPSPPTAPRAWSRRSACVSRPASGSAAGSTGWPTSAPSCPMRPPRR